LNASEVRPVIGLTTYLQQAQTGVWDVRASFLPAIYFEGVGLAGGISTLLPPQPVDDAIADRILDGLDGLIITGGRDVDPAVYGSTRHPATDEPTEDSRTRDAFELALLHAALRRGVPVHVHPHVLRHSFASHLLQSSGDLRAVQELLGLASTATTEIYTALDFQRLARVYDSAHPRARRR